MKDNIRIFWLTLKYWNQGDEWKIARDYARRIVWGFKKNG